MSDKMDFQKAMDKINSLQRFGSRPGLERIKILLDKLDNPQNKLKYVHVAGTNGKGSVCAMVSKILEKEGYKTGLFISPFVVEFCERMQINGEIIPQGTLASLVERTFPYVSELLENGTEITEFEYITSLAFLWFAEENCDIVVLETGLGGRFDATNIIEESVVDIITPISLDHTDVLGDTLEKICDEKRQIIKLKSKVVYYRQDDCVNKLIEEFAKKQKAHIYHADEAKIIPCKGTVRKNGFIFQGKRYLMSLCGRYQIKNAAIALTAVNALRKSGFPVSEKAFEEGFASAVNPGRLEYIKTDVPVIIDGAHNPGAMHCLAESVKELLPGKRIICVIGMLKDKNTDESLHNLQGLFERVICTEPDSPRKLSAETLCQQSKHYFEKTEAIKDMTEAYKVAQKYAGKDGVILICGSLYLIGKIRPMLLGKAE